MNFNDDVSDVAEIFHPDLWLAVACHNGKLKLISTELRRTVGLLDSGHSTGLKKLDYTPFHGASILTVGYENFFNVWGIDNSSSFATIH